MVIILTVLCIAVALISWAKLKNPFNPFTFMFVLWAIWIPLSDAGFYHMRHPSEKTYGVVLCGLIAYLIGCLVGCLCRSIHTKQNASSKDDSTQINYSLLYVLCFIAIMFYLYQFSKVVPLILSGHSLGDIRELVFSDDENEMRSSGVIVALNYFLVTPTTYFMAAFLPVELFKTKKNKAIIIETIIMLLLWIMTTGGRTVLLFMGASVACVFIQRKINSNKSLIAFILEIGKIRISKLKVRIALISFSALFLAVMFWVTFSRTGKDTDLLHQLYVYFGAPIELLDYYIKDVDRHHSDLYGYGLSSFYGFAYPVMFVLRKLGIVNPYPQHMLTIHELSVTRLQDHVNLGGSVGINAFATLFFQPYLDGRFFGVAVSLFVLGFMAGLFYSKWKMQKSFMFQTAYLLILHKLLFSMVRFWFTQPGQAISLILAFIVFCPNALKVKYKR